MRRLRIGLWATALLALSVGGCKKTGGGNGAGGDGAMLKVELPAARPVGMDDPFARLSSDGVRQLNIGYRALKVKKYEDARAAFEAVTQVAPDYTPARFQAVRAAALGGKFADVPDAWAAVLARDFVAYAGKLDKAKELAPLRAAPEWAAIQKSEAAFREAYGKGLDKGFFFVARTRDAEPLKWKEGAAALDLKQEVYHFDPVALKYRRLTETDGHVYAIAASRDGKTLSFLVTRKLSQDGSGRQAFVDPELGYINLATLETVGPFKRAQSAGEIDLAFTDANEPCWVIDGAAFVSDSAHTALVASTIVPHGSSTVARPVNVHRDAHTGAGVSIDPDGKSLHLDGVDKPVRAARDLDPSSVEWSPGKKRLTYAGTIDACKMLNEGSKEKNELFVWDQEKKSASRLAAGVSYFDIVWLDDDKLVYEGGIGKDGKLHMVDLPTRNDVVLKPRYGAGLFGFPTLSCEPAPDAVAPGDQPDTDTDTDANEGD